MIRLLFIVDDPDVVLLDINLPDLDGLRVPRGDSIHTGTARRYNAHCIPYLQL